MLEKNIQFSSKIVEGPSANAMVWEPGPFLQQMQHQADFCSLDRHVHALGSHPA